MTMERGLLSRYFDGVAVKNLSAVETDPGTSNQHEFNGSAPLRRLLGDDDRRSIPTRFVWLSDEQEGVSDDGVVSWYDSRKNKKHRSAEFRLYYTTNAVSEMMTTGDSLFLASRPDGSVMVIVARSGSTIQSQLLWMFGVEQPEFEFKFREIPKEADKVDFALRYILDELGIEPEEPDAEEFDRLLAPFATKFPTTRAFSELARKSLKDINALDDPDSVLMAWIEREELLFRRLERRLVAVRLETGFVNRDGADIDSFLSYSLHVQNRRKSRAGQSLENQFEALLGARKIRYSRGAETENRNKPDFLFPGVNEYHDQDFTASNLTMLAAKSTCKDRWRQALSEAERISRKHLLTLEPGISENQTTEMRAKNLQLVLPKRLHETYRESQRPTLMCVGDFLDFVLHRQ